MHFVNNGIGIMPRPSTGQLYSRTCFRANHPQRRTTGIAAREAGGFPAKGGREENRLGIRIQKGLCRTERVPLVWAKQSPAVYPINIQGASSELRFARPGMPNPF